MAIREPLWYPVKGDSSLRRTYWEGVRESKPEETTSNSSNILVVTKLAFTNLGN